MTPVIIIVATMVAMLAVYEITHRFFPSYGTITTNMVAGISMIADYLQILPWGTVLSPQDAALVGFAICAANGLIRFRGQKGPVGSGQK